MKLNVDEVEENECLRSKIHVKKSRCRNDDALKNHDDLKLIYGKSKSDEKWRTQDLTKIDEHNNVFDKIDEHDNVFDKIDEHDNVIDEVER